MSNGIVKPARIWKISLVVHSFCLILLQGFFQPFGDAQREETAIHARIFVATYTSPHFDDRSIST